MNQSETGDKENLENAKEVLMPVAKEHCTIFAQVRGNVFLKAFCADSQAVRDILKPYPISANGVEPEAGRSPVTFSSLQFQVAASPQELQNILDKGPYVECEG